MPEPLRKMLDALPLAWQRDEIAAGIRKALAELRYEMEYRAWEEAMGDDL
jgi:hypothetical protein